MASLEQAAECRVLLLHGPGGQRWRPPPDTTLTANQDLVVVTTGRGLADVSARTAAAAADPQA